MQINFRTLVASIVGVAGVLAVLILDGGHPSDFRNGASIAFVVALSFGFLIVQRGVTIACRLLKALFIKSSDDESGREVLIDAAEVLERGLMLAGILGLAGGALEALGFLDEPTRIGPFIHFGFVSLACCLCLVLCVTMPLKHQLLTEVAPEMRLTARATAARICGWTAFGLFVAVLMMAELLPREALTAFQLAPILLLAAALVPSALAASDGWLRSPVSARRQAWYANAAICTGVLAVNFGLVHVFSVLDEPQLLAPGIACAFGGLLIPTAVAAVMATRTPHASLQGWPSPRPTSHGLFAGFAGPAAIVMLGTTLVVIFALQDVFVTESPAPR